MSIVENVRGRVWSSSLSIGGPLLAMILSLAYTFPAVAQIGPDVIVGGTAVSGGSESDIVKYGSSGSITAYSIGSTSCNTAIESASFEPGRHQIRYPVFASRGMETARNDRAPTCK